MLVFLALIFLIYGGLHYYALGKVWHAFPHSVALGVALVLWGVLMTGGPLLIWFMVKQGWHASAAIFSWVAYCWMGFLFLFCCIALLIDVTGMLARAVALGWAFGGTAVLLGTALSALVLAGYGFFEARDLRVQHLSITTPKLATGPLTIAQLSDVHLGLMLGDDFLERVIAALQAARPDIVVVTGDLIDGQGDNLAPLAARLRQLAPRDGMYAILGNHEAFAGLETSINFLHSAGFTILRCDARAAGGIMLAGVDDPALGKRACEMPPETRRLLAEARANTYIVLLKHQPVVDDALPFDLQLSGHTHGGQLFPFGLFTLLAYHVRAGLYRYSGGRSLYISRGTGTWGPPMRLLAPPEITLITIRGDRDEVAPLKHSRAGGSSTR